jgi:hypothetical protein
MGRLLATMTALLLACAHERPSAERLFVSGTAYECGKEPMGRFAVGKTVRLKAGDIVLAEDVVGTDGKFVLHPREDKDFSGPVYIEAGSTRVSLANTYASWLQEHLSWHSTLHYGCKPLAEKAATRAPAPEDEADTPTRPPPSTHLVPHY